MAAPPVRPKVQTQMSTFTQSQSTVTPSVWVTTSSSSARLISTTRNRPNQIIVNPATKQWSGNNFCQLVFSCVQQREDIFLFIDEMTFRQCFSLNALMSARTLYFCGLLLSLQLNNSNIMALRLLFFVYLRVFDLVA